MTKTIITNEIAALDSAVAALRLRRSWLMGQRTKKARILRLFAEGKTKAEIARLVPASYYYVHEIIGPIERWAASLPR